MFKASGIILAGGAGTRLNGADKAQMVLKGRPLIEETVHMLRSWFAEVLIVTNSQRRYQYPQVRQVFDECHGCGPLMGLYSGLKKSRHSLNLVMGCDMPGISTAVIHLLMSQAEKADIVVPVVRGYREPLLAVYNRRVLGQIKTSIEAGQRKVISFFEAVNVCEIGEDQLRQVDPGLGSFVNINTPDDLAAARERFAAAEAG